jgi:trigger factor
MNISLENVDKVSAIITVNVEKADYEESVAKSLKNYRKNASIPGFRKGCVPMSLLQKRFGNDVKAEEINKLLGEKLYSYIRDNKVNMLGEPMPNKEKQAAQDINNDSFEYVFDIALAPEFDATVSADDKVEYYNIEISDEMVQQQVDSYARTTGSFQAVEEYADGDRLVGVLAELDENGSVKEGGLQVENASLLPQYFHDDEQKAIFNGCKTNDVLVFNPSVAYKNNPSEVSFLLKLEKEEGAKYTGNFSFQVTEVSRFTPAALDQTLFDAILGEGAVSSEEEFRGKIKEQMGEILSKNSDYKFLLDFKKYILEKIGNLEFPDALLKRFMIESKNVKEEELTDEYYKNSIDALVWHLVREQLCEKFEVKVNNDDVKEMAKQVAALQFAQYGMANVPEEVLDKYAEEMVKKQDQLNSLVERCIDQKLTEVLKSTVTLDSKSVSMDDFNKMMA